MKYKLAKMLNIDSDNPITKICGIEISVIDELSNLLEGLHVCANDYRIIRNKENLKILKIINKDVLHAHIIFKQYSNIIEVFYDILEEYGHNLHRDYYIQYAYSFE